MIQYNPLQYLPTAEELPIMIAKTLQKLFRNQGFTSAKSLNITSGWRFQMI